MDSAEHILSEHGIRPTPNRVMIFRTLSRSGRPLSMLEIEDILQTVDKSNISRTIAVFKENGLLHVLEDGSDSVRYELCHGNHDSAVNSDEHVHFHCEVCGRTYCLEGVSIPSVCFPEGYAVRSINYMAKGICPQCQSKSE